MTAEELPPTPARRRVADAIQRGKVRWYAHIKPFALWAELAAGIYSTKTATVREMAAADPPIAVIPDLPAGDYGPVTLTDAGRSWLANGGAP